MKKLLITLLLVSPFSFADWGDVYYCQTTNFVGISLDGERTNYPLEKFEFKLDKTKNAMVFADVGDFVLGETMNLVNDKSFPSNEQWFFSDEPGLGFFRMGKLLFASMLGIYGTITVSANCDKF